MYDSSPEHSLPTGELLASQAEWLQRLARRLVADENEAQDLVQDTLAIAFEKPPRTTDRLRGWLARVMRNRLAAGNRSAASREARERMGGAPLGAPGADELVERIHLQRRIADHLLALQEETRTVLVLRFYEDLPPRKIAQRLGLPVATVKSRLARGLQTLRSNMDDDHDGDRSAWALVLVPWLKAVQPSLATSTAGVLLMNTKVLVGAAIVAVGALYFTRGDDSNVESPESSGVVARPTAPIGASSESRDLAESMLDNSVSTRTGSGSAAPVASPKKQERFRIRGLLLDASGAPLGGLPVRLRGADGVTTSGAGGVFELMTTATEGTLEVADADWIAVCSARWSVSGSIEPVMVVAPVIRLAGVVSDPWGRRLAGTRLTLEPPADFETRFGERLDASIREEWSARSDDEGAFAFQRVPALPGATLRAVLGGFEPDVKPAPQQSQEGLWIELWRPRLAEEGALHGRVSRADGSPAVDALVALGDAVANTDEGGFFELALSAAGDADRLTAAEPGALPATLARSESVETDASGWPDFVELKLGGRPLSIEGRVVDADGNPRANGRVWVENATRFARVGAVPIQLEAFLAGGRVPDAALDSMAALTSASPNGALGSASPALESNAILSWAVTDAEGRFSLNGLQARDYVLNVADGDLHWCTQTHPIAAGSRGVRIEVPAEEAFARIAGRIVSEQGDPVPNVAITPWIAALHIVEPFGGGTSDVLRFFLGKTVSSDAEGRFELIDVPRAKLQFHAVSDDIIPSYFRVEDVDDPDSFELVVKARAHLKITIGPGQATSLRVVDVDHQPLTLLQMRADGYSSFSSLPLVDGRSGIVTVTTDAAELLLYAGEELVERIPLRLRPGAIETIAR